MQFREIEKKEMLQTYSRDAREKSDTGEMMKKTWNLLHKSVVGDKMQPCVQRRALSRARTLSKLTRQ